MSAIAKALSGWRMIDLYAGRDNWITALDPRAKFLSCFGVVIAMASADAYTTVGLLPYLALPLVMLQGAGIPLGWVARRVAWALPFALMVGFLNPWLDNTRWVTPWGAETSAGWLSFTSIQLRCIISVSIAVLLLATTGMPRLSMGLSRMGVPKMFVLQLQLLYRYIFVIGEELGRMQQAWHLRALRPLRAMSIAIASNLLGSLIFRSYGRGVRLNNAMLARGFTGSLPAGPALRWRLADSLWLSFWGLFILLIVLVQKAVSGEAVL